jgi:hypothetical protein
MLSPSRVTEMPAMVPLDYDARQIWGHNAANASAAAALTPGEAVATLSPP